MGRPARRTVPVGEARDRYHAHVRLCRRGWRRPGPHVVPADRRTRPGRHRPKGRGRAGPPIWGKPVTAITPMFGYAGEAGGGPASMWYRLTGGPDRADTARRFGAALAIRSGGSP